MRVQLLPFGVLKESLTETVLDLPQQATVADLLKQLQSRLGANSVTAQMLDRIAVSVNAEYAQAGQPLREGDLVGLLPPVSGGSGAVWLTRQPIPAGELIAAAKQGSDGAVIVFDGIVRDNTRGRRTLYLDYEAYEEMAERQMAALIEQARDRFAIREATIVHRLGRLEIGETSVLILVSSAHRGAAFDASRWLIDTLKKTVPIWKKETFADGVVWSDGEPFPPELVPGALLPEQSA
jgi:molybdopterin synthase catalytic subunit/molybdopterin converting factor small subunit